VLYRILLYSNDLGWFSYLKIWYLHKVAIVLLSEFIFNNAKINSMKETIIKISIHIIVSEFFTNLECLIRLIGGQAIPLDRLCQYEFECKFLR